MSFVMTLCSEAVIVNDIKNDFYLFGKPDLHDRVCFGNVCGDALVQIHSRRVC